jgi:glycosyltransferase involved in cell wall biosynthesis
MVIIFQQVVPHYRTAFFRELNRYLNGQMVVCAAQKPTQGMEVEKGIECDFALRNIQTVTLQLPFSKSMVSMQPHAIASLVSRRCPVIIMMNQVSCVDSWILLLASRILRKKIILWGHGISTRDGRATVKLRKIMMQLAHANIVYSESGKERATREGLQSKKLFVAYNALDTERSKALKNKIGITELERFRRDNDLQGRRLVFFSGRLQDRKKPGLLVQAMQEVSRAIPDSLAIIVGEGPMRKSLQTLIKDLGLDQHVRLLGAVFDEEIVARYLLCSNVAVMPSAAGLAIQHAFAYGVPIIVGDDMTSHGPEISLVENGSTGYFFKDDDYEALSRLISLILSNEGERNRLSRNCTQIIEEKNNIGNMVAGFSDAINFVLRKTNKI